MFSPQSVGGAFPSTLAKKVDKGKQTMTEAEIQAEIRHEEEDLHETEQDFDLVDLDEHDDDEITSIVIKEKEAKIKELQNNLDKSNFVIEFLE